MNTIDQAKIAYVDGKYARVVDLLEPTVTGTQDNPAAIVTLPSEDQVELLSLLGLAHLLTAEPNTKEAEQIFVMLLKQDPDHQFVEGLHPKDALELLDKVRRDYADELPDPNISPGSGNTIYIQREVFKNQLGLSFVPFGVGQYQNDGPTFKFWLFMLTEVAALTTNVIGFAWVESLRSGNGLYTPDNAQDAEEIQQVQLWAFRIFIGLVFVGAAEAWYNYEPESVQIRTLDGPPPELRANRAVRPASRARLLPRPTAAPRPVLIAPPPMPKQSCDPGRCPASQSSGIVLGVALPF